jgi:hypothetical protein
MTDDAGKPVVLEYRGAEANPGWPEVFSPHGTEFLLIRAGADLPERCVKCNRPGSGRQVRVWLRWVDPGDRDGYRGTTVGPITLIVWIGFFIEGLIKQRVVRSGLSLCPKHRALRWTKLIAWLMVPLAGVLVFRFGLAAKSPATIMCAVIGFVVWLTTFEHRPRLLRVVGMENGYYIVTGAGESFRTSLPSQ